MNNMTKVTFGEKKGRKDKNKSYVLYFQLCKVINQALVNRTS